MTPRRRSRDQPRSKKGSRCCPRAGRTRQPGRPSVFYNGEERSGQRGVIEGPPTKMQKEALLCGLLWLVITGERHHGGDGDSVLQVKEAVRAAAQQELVMESVVHRPPDPNIRKR